MQKGRWQFGVLAVVALGALILCNLPLAFADSSTSSSSHYQASQLQFGSSDTDEGCSTQYCAATGVGGIGTGDSSSKSYSASFGPITSSDPLLEVIVSTGASDLGNFSSTETTTKLMTVKIRSYLSSGYMLQITGTPPKTRGHTLTALTAPTASAPGTEQFGLNAVANTLPPLGTDPVQVPSGQTSFGAVTANYATPNKFMYKSGDVIASSNKSSGETDYTISMVINISNNTPAGKYSSDFSAVVIPAY